MNAIEKSEGKTSLLTTNKFLLEEGNGKFVSHRTMESYICTRSDLGEFQGAIKATKKYG